jgi:regulator of sirC expression with transglutaminase-like and TPR domain
LKDSKENKELDALISLLDEPSNQVFDQIREKILFYGIEAIPFLEKAWDNSFDSIIQSRIEEILHHIQLNSLNKDIVEWKEKSHLDLLSGFIIASKFQYPDISEVDILQKVEKIEKDIWLELNDNLTALEKIKVVNHILFEVHRFSGNKTHIDAPQNLFINNLLETKKGNHLTIGILYIILAQKLNLPVFGVNLPQHFILAYVDEYNEELIQSVNEDEVLFYINPFNKGAVFTKKEIEMFIRHLKLKPSVIYYQPCDNISIIKRLFENMLYVFNKLGHNDKVEELKQLIAKI